MLNPYANVDWTNDSQIITTTHDHVKDSNVSTTTKQHFDNLYNGGVRCFAISNYYPSVPMYPLSDYVADIGGTVPADIIEIPNAEHHNLAVYGRTGNSVHINSLGSMFSSGKPRGESPTGFAGGRVETLIAEVTSQLLYSDGGGLTLNHPTWTWEQNLFSMDTFCYLLDLDERVLGIEIFNTNRYDTVLWDYILNTGRRCWGFAVPDHYHKTHTTWYGRNVLIVPEPTQHECLRAFRNGNMYCKHADTELKFTGITLVGSTLTASTNEPATIKFIGDGIAISETDNVTSASVNTDGLLHYVRVEAETAIDRILSQPIMFSTQSRKNNVRRKYWQGI